MSEDTEETSDSSGCGPGIFLVFVVMCIMAVICVIGFMVMMTAEERDKDQRRRWEHIQRENDRQITVTIVAIGWSGGYTFRGTGSTGSATSVVELENGDRHTVYSVLGKEGEKVIIRNGQLGPKVSTSTGPTPGKE